MFRFATPEYLYLLLLLPALAVVYIFCVQRTRRMLKRFGNPNTVASLMPERSPRRGRYKFIIYLTALTILIFALARPQVGSKLREVKREGIEIMLAIDVSNSMLASDISPSRLERTKYAVNRLLEGLNEDMVGVIVFAGEAYVQLPITSDYVTAANFVSQIAPNMVSKQGTAIGAAIDMAAASFTSGTENSRVIILITDGENHEDNPLAAARHAASQGIRIYAIGIGTPEGSPIAMGNDFVRDDQGTIVVTKLDEKILQDIALSTNGAYVRAGNQNFGLTEIVKKINETEKAELSAVVFDEYSEQYQYLLAIALALLVIETLILSRKSRVLARFNVFR